MTTSKFTFQYDKGTAESDPKIRLVVYLSVPLLFRLLWKSLLGKPELVETTLSEREIDTAATLITRYRIVQRLRTAIHSKGR